MKRRRFLGRALGVVSASSALAANVGCAGVPRQARPQVVVVGGGFGGATAAKYLRLWSAGTLDVTLVEPAAAFVSCPVSNLVVAGLKTLDDITLPYDTLVQRHGVRWRRDTVTAIDLPSRELRLAGGGRLRFDKLVLSPGVDLMSASVEGLPAAQAEGRVLHAWKAGPETAALHRQLQALRPGGVFAITIPLAPYRCPPGPYERASLVADWLGRHNPRAKVLVLDANDDVVSKAALFKQAWAELHAGRIEYRPQHGLIGVDAEQGRLRFEVQDDVRADVLNVLPPMRAGAIAVQAGLATVNQRWCPVAFQTFASVHAPQVHVLGDAIQAAPLMPKSGHMANNHAKVAAAAIVAELAGLPPPAEPMLTNTCYSLVSADQAIHVASVHRYDAAARTFNVVPGSGGVSAARSTQEVRLAEAWARNTWADMLA
ncbi:NAD(P)/FAD-dependent oxidoreductase [Aquincola tertiaricarbonis]|uniref:NAD(P)/FAD-dependent oxidoreductase n=1 Tax=Aquincola tertiaricarbonis TaxID=391953 RepID=A0ABY4S4Z7_AQUTE|nr:NAD(P)/FAD-dependent oxidoreductase [Aquincola tertiaricarbonis]URI08506.1 NAD(P)/FAD-dependent oxidoreductase [Aquincola tertiaricarbonis]